MSLYVLLNQCSMNVVHCLNNEYQSQLQKWVCKRFCVKQASDSRGVGTPDRVSDLTYEDEMVHKRDPATKDPVSAFCVPKVSAFGTQNGSLKSHPKDNSPEPKWAYINLKLKFKIEECLMYRDFLPGLSHPERGTHLYSKLHISSPGLSSSVRACPFGNTYLLSSYFS